MHESSNLTNYGQQDRTYKALLEALTQGKWMAGERLPSERLLAEEYQCSRGTIRSVLIRLVNQDLLACKDRSGYYVKFFRRQPVTRNLALIVRSVHQNFSEYPYLNRLLQGFMAIASNERFLCNAFIISPKETFFTGAKRLQINWKQYDGFIFAWSLSAQEVADLKKADIQFVSLTKPQCLEAINYVDMDNFQGAYIATRHLLEQGRRHPIFMNGTEELSYNHSKTEGFKKALQEFGLPFSPNMILEIDPDEESMARLQTSRLLENKALSFDSLMIYGDWATYGAVQVLQQHKVRIPEDVSVVMYDDYSWVIWALDIPMATIHQPLEEQIQAAVRLLLRQLNTPQAVPMSEIIQPSLRIIQTS